MRKRVINGRINYEKGIRRNRLESILWTILTEQKPYGSKQQENI